MNKTSNRSLIGQPINDSHREIVTGITDSEYASQQLERAYDTKLSRRERDFERWKYLNPDVVNIPPRFTPLINLEKRKFDAQRFANDAQAGLIGIDKLKQVSQLRYDLESELAGRNERREQENKLADYIEDVIAPLGLISYERGDKSFTDHPLEVADKFRLCRKESTVMLNFSTGKRLAIYDDKCGYSKFCPDEARHETQRLIETDVPAIETFLKVSRFHTFQYAVLTVPNYKNEKEGLKDIRERYNKLKVLKCMSAVKGARLIIESPLSADGNWNIHINAMFLIDGFFDWKEIRKAWGYNIHFESAEQMERKTRNKLIKRGVDVSGMTVNTVLINAYQELCKYAGAPVSSKSAEKSDSGSSKAPVMTKWPADKWIENWIAMKGYRRSWGNGIVYDTYGYRWSMADNERKSFYLDKAGLSEELLELPWRRGDIHLDKDQRMALRDAMDEREKVDIEEYQSIGRMSYNRATGYVIHIDLIPEDKFVSGAEYSMEISSKVATGPPPDDGYTDALMEAYQ